MPKIYRMFIYHLYAILKNEFKIEVPAQALNKFTFQFIFMWILAT